MSWLDEVPIKILLGSLGERKKEVELVTAPEIIVPDYLKILQETEYAFNLENWVLTGMQVSYGVPSAHHPSVTSKAATCPPYWMLFSSPQQSRLAGRWSSDFWEPNPLRRSRSLNAAHFHVMNDTVKFKISDSDEDESPDNEEASFIRPNCNSSGLKRQELDVTLPSQLHSSILQCSFPSLKAREEKLWKIQNDGDSFHELSSPSLNSSVPLAPTRPLGSHATVHDSSVELLSALRPEERELLQAVMQHGYSLRTAIVALQKTGHRSPEQILSYLVACDHLYELGYDKAQVEEALEMFQNCEKQAEEFLHLFTQFHEMGFQQNAIKEVLLMHGNHRDHALEELMMQVA